MSTGAFLGKRKDASKIIPHELYLKKEREARLLAKCEPAGDKVM